jgi:hypothetical protein
MALTMLLGFGLNPSIGSVVARKQGVAPKETSNARPAICVPKGRVLGDNRNGMKVMLLTENAHKCNAGQQRFPEGGF